MKKIIIASGVLALMGAFTSCDKYDIYPEQYGDVMMIKNAGEKEVTIYATDDAAEFPITVMKGGHTPGDPANAELRVMNEEDLKAFKERLYGDPNFPGLVYLKSEFYQIIDQNGQVMEDGVVTHDFTSADDRYFTAKIVLDAQKISDWRLEMEETEEGRKELNEKKFVIPMGLYSETDSVNSDSYFLMLEPKVTDPVAAVEVEHNGYNLTEVSRTKLVDDPKFLEIPLEPEVYLSVPCKNQYGFGIKIDTKSSFVSDFNSKHTDVQLKMLTKDTYTVGSEINGEVEKNVIYFPAGVTKVRVPLTIDTKKINANNLATNWVLPFQLKPATGSKEGIDMIWYDENVPDKVKKSLKLPRNPDNSKENYTFFVGYKVVETPLELNDGNVTSNDCEPTEGSIAALFDGNLSTFFHSGWTVAFERDKTFASYLEIEVPTNNPCNACYFQFTSRVHANPASPSLVHLYYTNEEDPTYREINKDKNNQEVWHFFDKVEMKKALGSGETGELGSLDNMAVAPETFKYLRFCVMKSNRGDLTAPSTAIYWNLAELRMYGKYIDPNATPDPEPEPTPEEE